MLETLRQTLGRKPAATPAERLSPAQRRFFEDNGYLILRGLFTSAQVAAFRENLDALWAMRRDGSPYVIDSYIATPRQQRGYFRDVPDDARALPYKLNDLHLGDPVVQRTCLDPGLVAALGDLLGAPPVAINTLLLEHGSQQPAHFDTFYMPSRSPNLMAASWIALEAATDANGPLFYYPGSHRIPPYRFSHGELWAIDAEVPAAMAHIQRIIAEYRLREERLFAEPGDVLIWHAQLLHGGKPITRPGATRLSLVTHYHTTIDVSDPASRIDLGDGRLVLDKPHPYVLDASTRAELGRFLDTLGTTDADRAAVPAGFDPVAYLMRNKDVLAARVDPYKHYDRFGRREGRAW
jgi:ectoine hydroxylase-related dioxygenase (phytanoyl-CoA dioxygenase family)